MVSDADDDWISVLALSVVGMVTAGAWPFIFPVLDYVMAIIKFGSSPGLLNTINAIKEFGSLYGESPTAPGDAFASLPYLTKAGLLMYASIPIYVIAFLVFVGVGLMSFLSRLLPWQKLSAVVQVIAIGAAVLPLIAIYLWWITLVGISYVQALSVSLLDFVFLIVLFPLVLAKVVSPWLGIFMLAIFFVPSGLVFAGHGSKARKAYHSVSRSFMG
jgi:hypothetical protein